MRRIALQIALGLSALSIVAPVRASSAHAKRPSVALFATSGANEDDAALDPSLLAAIEQLGEVRVTVRPDLDLETVQLAIDCAGQSSACLHAVAATSGVDGVIAPTLTRTDRELVLDVIYFDAQHDRIARAQRKQSGRSLAPSLLSEIPGLLRELFGLPAEPAPVETPPAQAAAPATPAVAAAAAKETASPAADGGGAEPNPIRPSARPLPIAPIVIAGMGVLAIGGAIIAGSMSQSTHDAYTKLLPPEDMRQVNLALERSSRGESQALVANVLYGVGAATLVGAAVWLAIDFASSHESATALARSRTGSTALAPAFGPGAFGVLLTHRGASL